MERSVKGVCSLVLGACILSGCTATTYQSQANDGRVRGAFEQPFRDVSWMRENAPEILVRAAEAPYALASSECGPVLEEVAALDLVLGPDVDAPDDDEEESNTDGAGLLSGAIRGVIGLPYRSIVRRLSGAERRERALREAILAGMVRRAFLKGFANAADCAAAEAPAPVTPP